MRSSYVETHASDDDSDDDDDDDDDYKKYKLIAARQRLYLCPVHMAEYYRSIKSVGVNRALAPIR